MSALAAFKRQWSPPIGKSTETGASFGIYSLLFNCIAQKEQAVLQPVLCRLSKKSIFLLPSFRRAKEFWPDTPSPAGLDGQNCRISMLPGIHFSEAFPFEARRPSSLFVEKQVFRQAKKNRLFYSLFFDQSDFYPMPSKLLSTSSILSGCFFPVASCTATVTIIETGSDINSGSRF
jgi:hypothetical protein